MKQTNELSITIPALKKPSLKALQAKWSWITKIERDISPTKATTLNLITVLEDGESYISGSEYEKRLPKNLLGFQQAQWLVENQDKFPELKPLLGQIYIDFIGLVVVRSGGSRFCPCLDQDDKRWGLYWRWLDGSFGSFGRVAASGQVVTRKLGALDSCSLGSLPDELNINGTIYKKQ